MRNSDFNISDLITAREYDNENYRFIDAIRFEREITQACSNIRNKIGVNYISCFLVLPSGAKFIISNNPGKIAVPYHIHGLSRIDNIFSPERYKKQTSGCFVPSEIPNDRLGHLFEKILSEKFGVANTIGFIRSVDGYQFITIFGQDLNNKNSMFCQPKEKDLYNYVVEFFDEILLFYAQDKPQLRYSRFCQDPLFRNKLIRGELKDEALNLKERELQCLYWARMGKTAEEIAVILGLKKSTVRGYLESIREKCRVSSIQEAIVLAIQQKFIS